MDHRAHALQLMRRLGDRRSTAELLIADAATIMRRGGVRRDTLMRLQEASQLAAQVGWQEGVVQSEQAIRDSEPVDAAASVKSGTESAPARLR
jgi:hypothetical protein